MSGFWGMDTAQGDDFGTLLGRARTTTEQRFGDLQSVVSGIVGTQWVGPDADAFSERYAQEVTAGVDAAVARMQTLLTELTQHIQEQETASGAGDASGDIVLTSTVLPTQTPPPAPETEERPGFWQRWVEGFLDNLTPSWMGGATTLTSVVHNLPGYLLENVPRFVPILGDVYTGLLAGAERFGEESHLPLGERLQRAALDGVLTGGGSFIGGTAGTLIGAFGGVLAGGGSVGLAGAAAGAAVGGVGAIPGALAGAGTGAIVGGVLGGIAGDLIGGYVGSAAGAGLADAILD